MKRRAAFALVFILILAVSVVGAQAGSSLQLGGGFASDDFEDGDLQEWDDPGASDVTYSVGSEHVQEGNFALNQTGHAVNAGDEVALTTNETFGLAASEDFEVTVYMFLDNIYPGDDGRHTLRLNDGTERIEVGYRAHNNDLFATGSLFGSAIFASVTPSQGQYYKLHLEFDYSDNEIRFYVDDQLQGTTTTGGSWANEESIKLESFVLHNVNPPADDDEVWYDNISVDGVAPANHTVSGFVKDPDGSVVEGATVTNNVTDSNDETGADGAYTLGLDNGTYEITANHPDFNPNSITVTVDGADLTNQNITLSDEELELDVKTFMEHGSTQDYKVFLGSEDVTAQATVTTSDAGVVNVDTVNHELIAASDESINAQADITATYEGISTTETVTVANKTLDNIPILPPATWPVAIIGQPGDTTGSSGTWPGAIQLQWLFVAMAVGAIVSWASANPFMGLGTVEFMLLFGWVISWISDGMLIASIIFLVYASLSLTDIASGNLGHR